MSALCLFIMYHYCSFSIVFFSLRHMIHIEIMLRVFAKLFGATVEEERYDGNKNHGN